MQANGHDSQGLASLLHGNEQRVYGDKIKQKVPKAKEFTQARAFRDRALSEVDIAHNKTQSTVRARVEPAFLVIKKIVGGDKVRYKGLAKNAHPLKVLCALANRYQARHWFERRQPSGV